MSSARLLWVFSAAAFAVGASFTARAQIETIAPKEGKQLREIRCNQDAQAGHRQLLRLTREQCLIIGRETSILPQQVPADRRQTTFGAMTANTRIGQAPPPNIRVSQLPGRVTESFPHLSRYRYFISCDDIAIVDPGADIVVAIIDVHVRPRLKQGALPSTRPSE
jgi:hypothetical protein